MDGKIILIYSHQHIWIIPKRTMHSDYFVEELKYPINLENIKSIEITEEKPKKTEESTIYETLKVEIYDDTYRKYHFNRAIRMFSYFKKTCKKTEKENTYELTVDYDKSDESEVVIKILMFGPNMKVLEPIDVSDKVNQRISKQKELNARLI